jgi:hypothetical protein
MKRIALAALVGTATAAASLAIGVGIAAAAGQTGPYITGEGICEPGRIIATSALVSPSVTAYSSPGTFGVGGTQRVGFRAHLARLASNGSWVTVDSGNWKVRDAALQGEIAVNSFLDLRTGLWGPGGTTFPITRAGVYRVFYELYWYGNQYVRDGYLSDWASAHREYRFGGAYLQQAYGACQY